MLQTLREILPAPGTFGYYLLRGTLTFLICAVVARVLGWLIWRLELSRLAIRQRRFLDKTRRPSALREGRLHRPPRRRLSAGPYRERIAGLERACKRLVPTCRAWARALAFLRTRRRARLGRRCWLVERFVVG